MGGGGRGDKTPFVLHLVAFVSFQHGRWIAAIKKIRLSSKRGCWSQVNAQIKNGQQKRMEKK